MMPRKNRRVRAQLLRALLPLIACWWAFASPAADKPPASYRLGILPYMAPRQTVEFFGPVAASMEAALKHPVKLESVPTFADFRRAMAAQSYDIALVQPFDYPELVEKQGYHPLAQMAVPLVTQFFVRDDSPLKKIEDLRGTTVAMPPAEAANARMALRALYDNKLIPGRDVELRYFNSHDSCIQQVWAGAASACGTAKPPIAVFEQRMQAKLRSIHDTPPVPHIVFVAHPRVPAAQRAALAERITGWSQTDDGRALLKSLGFPGFVTPKPAEYAMMRNYDPVAAAKAAAPAAGKDLVLGVFPYLNTRQLAQNFAPVLEALGRTLGTTLHLRTAPNFSSFQEAVTAAAHDIVFVQPFDYALAAKHGYLPLAAMKDPVEGVFSVLEKNHYREIADFKGKVVAMPPVDAALSRLGRLALTQAGLTPDRDVNITYFKNHDACLQAVKRESAATCVISLRSLSALPKETTQVVRTIGQTHSVPGAVFMAHKRLPAKVREQVKAEIIGWKDSEAGRAILKSMQLGDLGPVDPAEYQRLSQRWGSN